MAGSSAEKAPVLCPTFFQKPKIRISTRFSTTAQLIGNMVYMKRDVYVTVSRVNMNSILQYRSLRKESLVQYGRREMSEKSTYIEN